LNYGVSINIKRIRAVDRALLVIDVLSQSGLCSLTELRQKTGLDNAGLLRILGTMIDRGWVRQLIVEKRYELSHSLGDILGAAARSHPMAEIAIPIITADGIHGSLSLLWLEEHLSADTVIRSGLLERLKASAVDISTKLTKGSISPPV
jgi:DNA-binding IclR family transcriptional regulator